MNIYTSYFANMKKLDKEKYTFISISLYPPKWYEGKVYKKVAPSNEILMDWKNGKKDEEARSHYERMYSFKILRKLNAKDILKDLEELSEGKDIVLLCFEKSGDFCHRYLLSKFLEKELSILIEEL